MNVIEIAFCFAHLETTMVASSNMSKSLKLITELDDRSITHKGYDNKELHVSETSKKAWPRPAAFIFSLKSCSISSTIFGTSARSFILDWKESTAKPMIPIFLNCTWSTHRASPRPRLWSLHSAQPVACSQGQPGLISVPSSNYLRWGGGCPREYQSQYDSALSPESFLENI